MSYLARRLGRYLLTAWAAITANFVIPRLVPGNPAGRRANPCDPGQPEGPCDEYAIVHLQAGQLAAADAIAVPNRWGDCAETMDTVSMDEMTVARPEISSEIRQAARAAGGGWLDEVVGDHKPPVPQRFIKGAWRLDANGELTGEYVPNPEYGRREVRCPYSGGRSGA